MTKPTVADPNTGVATTPFIGGDPIQPITPTTPESRGDIIAPKSGAAADSAVPIPPVVVADPPADPAAPPATDPPADPATATQTPVDPAAATPPRDDKGKFIPKKRFDEVNERMKAAEAKIAADEAAKAAAAAATANQYDFDAKEQEYIDLVLDGKKTEAAALRKEIRAAEASAYEVVATQKAQTVTQQQTTQQRIDAVSVRYEADYDVLNPESENYSEAVLNDVSALMAGYSRSGQYADAAQALEASIKGALKMHDIPLKADAATPTPTVAAPPTTPATPARTAQKRVEAIVATPPLIARTGVQSADHGTTTVDVKTLSDSEFSKLPDETKRRLRGDFV